MAHEILHFDIQQIRDQRSHRTREQLRDEVGRIQIAVFTMCGGGMLGRSAAEQPGAFYIDDRVGKLPYSREAIIAAVDVLAALSYIAGLDPRSLPNMPGFHNLGVF